MTRGAHRTIRRGDAPARRPFQLVDELICYFDTPDEPANIHLEVQVSGHLDRDVFRRAAEAALLADLRASSRRVRPGWLTRRYAWEYPGTLDVDPVCFATCRDAAELARTREDFIARTPSIDSAPPARLLLVRGPDHDHVILNAHHATMDGLSWLEFLRDLGRRYRLGDGSATRTAAAAAAPVSPAMALPLPAPVPSDPVPRRAGRALKSGVLPARVAADHGGGRGCGLQLLALPGVPAVLRPAGEARATLNDALVAALALTVSRWNTEHGRRPREVRITVPVNARPEGRPDLTGNHSRNVTIKIESSLADASPASVLAEVAMQMIAARQSSGPPVPAGLRTAATRWCPAVVKRVVVRLAQRTVGPLVVDTAMLTNLGRVPDAPDFGLAATVVMTLSGPAQMPRGLSFAAITAGGEVRLGLRYNRALLDDGAAARFLAAYALALNLLTGTAATDAATTEREGGPDGLGRGPAEDPGLPGRQGQPDLPARRDGTVQPAAAAQVPDHR